MRFTVTYCAAVFCEVCVGFGTDCAPFRRRKRPDPRPVFQRNETMKKLIVTCVALTGIGLLHTKPAQADHRRGFSMQFGSSGMRFGISTRNYSGYRGYNRGYGSNRYSCQPQGWYHNTSHWDYRPPTVYRHLNHYHQQPGGYEYHRTGHWHH